MNYVKHILLPTEQVLYDGHVHPTVLVPGLILLGIAAWILTESGNTGGAHSILIGFTYYLATYSSFMADIYSKLSHWQQASPNIALDLKVVALGVGLYGFTRLATALVLMETTELVVTDQRVIAKTGVFTVITVEMDRRRIAGVTVYQTVPGRIMGYGYVMIQGFTSHIGGLPPMVNPHLVERFVG
jgi:hypothetical protein